MPAFLELPVRNTFVHFSEEIVDDCTPVRHSKSEPIESTLPMLLRPDVRRKTALAELSSWCESATSGREPWNKSPRELKRSDSRDSTSIGSFAECNSDSEDIGKIDSAVCQDCRCLGTRDAWAAPSPKPAVEPDSPEASRSPAAPPQQESPARQPLQLVPLLWPFPMPVMPMPTGAGCPQPPTAAQQTTASQPLALAGGETACVSWTVHTSQIESRNNKICSETFLVALPGSGTYPFQLILYAEDRVSKGPSGGFQRSRGRGRVEVRCQAELPPGVGKVNVSVAIGTGGRALPAREPAVQDFSQQACCGWRRMDFSQAVDPATHTFAVRAIFAPQTLAVV